MKRIMLASAVIIALFSSCNNEIVCNKFDVSYELQDNTLIVSLDTDLPEFTELMVSVSRNYTEVGIDSIYSMDYYNEKMTVKSILQSLEIDIKDEIWIANSEKHRKEMDAMNLGYEIEKIDDNISINLVVPVNQLNTAFGDNNKNLVGGKVNETGLRVVRDQKILSLPMK